MLSECYWHLCWQHQRWFHCFQRYQCQRSGTANQKKPAIKAPCSVWRTKANNGNAIGIDQDNVSMTGDGVIGANASISSIAHWSTISTGKNSDPKQQPWQQRINGLKSLPSLVLIGIPKPSQKYLSNLKPSAQPKGGWQQQKWNHELGKTSHGERPQCKEHS